MCVGGRGADTRFRKSVLEHGEGGVVIAEVWSRRERTQWGDVFQMTNHGFSRGLNGEHACVCQGQSLGVTLDALLQASLHTGTPCPRGLFLGYRFVSAFRSLGKFAFSMKHLQARQQSSLPSPLSSHPLTRGLLRHTPHC